MAASDPFSFVKLDESYVPGAKFVYESVDKHSNTQLSRWLQCRGLRKTGVRSVLLHRVHICVAAGAEKNIDVSIDGGKLYELKKEDKLPSSRLSTSSVPLLPYCGWKKFPSCHGQMPQHFNQGHIHHHVVESVQFVNAEEINDECDEDIEDLHTEKPLRKGLTFFQSGHVKKMQDCAKAGHYFLKAKVMASMRTNVEYDVTVTLSQMSGFVKDASCTCVASAMGRCSHVTGLLYALEDFLDQASTDPDMTSCTSMPCTWNKGRQQNKNPKPVQELNYSTKQRKFHDVIKFDPRAPSTIIEHDDQVKEVMLWSLEKQALYDSMWLSLLERHYDDYDLDASRLEVLKDLRISFLENLKVESGGGGYPVLLVEAQRSDSWFTERRVRLTASTCHTVVALQSGVANFLKKQLWNTERVSSAAISYGVQNESVAFQSYKSLKCGDRHHVIETGLWVSSSDPELACSPDGLIMDLDEPDRNGLLEIKFPKMLENKTISDFTNVLTPKQLKYFCLETADGEINLKTKHSYYSQIQMQMGVTGLKFCDFVVWSCKEVFVRRIRFDYQFWSEMKKKLLLFHHSYICPELFEMRIPRDLPPFHIEYSIDSLALQCK